MYNNINIFLLYIVIGTGDGMVLPLVIYSIISKIGLFRNLTNKKLKCLYIYNAY